MYRLKIFFVFWWHPRATFMERQTGSWWVAHIMEIICKLSSIASALSVSFQQKIVRGRMARTFPLVSMQCWPSSKFPFATLSTLNPSKHHEKIVSVFLDVLYTRGNLSSIRLLINHWDTKQSLLPDTSCRPSTHHNVLSKMLSVSNLFSSRPSSTQPWKDHLFRRAQTDGALLNAFSWLTLNLSHLPCIWRPLTVKVSRGFDEIKIFGLFSSVYHLRDARMHWSWTW